MQGIALIRYTSSRFPPGRRNRFRKGVCPNAVSTSPGMVFAVLVSGRSGSSYEKKMRMLPFSGNIHPETMFGDEPGDVRFRVLHPRMTLSNGI